MLIQLDEDTWIDPEAVDSVSVHNERLYNTLILQSKIHVGELVFYSTKPIPEIVKLINDARVEQRVQEEIPKESEELVHRYGAMRWGRSHTVCGKPSVSLKMSMIPDRVTCPECLKDKAESESNTYIHKGVFFTNFVICGRRMAFVNWRRDWDEVTCPDCLMHAPEASKSIVHGEGAMSDVTMCWSDKSGATTTRDMTEVTCEKCLKKLAILKDAEVGVIHFNGGSPNDDGPFPTCWSWNPNIPFATSDYWSMVTCKSCIGKKVDD